jgi:hypothetical protein
LYANDCGGKSFIAATFGGPAELHYDASDRLIGSFVTDDNWGFCGGRATLRGKRCHPIGEALPLCPSQ